MEVSKKKNSDASGNTDDISDNLDLFREVDKVIKKQKEKRERGQLVVTVK
jgi:hypothetical protein